MLKEKTVHLNALDLDVSVPENVYFYDDGFVESLGGHEYYVNWKYAGKLPPIKSIIDSEQHVGHILYLKDFRDGRHFYIAYLHSSSSPINTRGHEETHFLQETNRLSFLSRRIMQRQGVEIDLEEIQSRIVDKHQRLETTADIGGIFCKYQRDGWQSVLNFQRSNLPRSQYFEEAYTIYSSAIEDSLKKSKNSKKSEGLIEKLTGLFKN